MDIIRRPYWVKKINDSWKKVPIVWLAGVRRSGKTSLAKMFKNSIYLNCDLPSVQEQISDPESFYNSQKKGAIIIFDEIHRLENPSQLLKIAADEYPHLKILATGSSTLSATKKFKDSLTGRKRTLYLSPVLWTECISNFKILDFDRRLHRGGLPKQLLTPLWEPEFYSEWIESFYARDIQELFSIRNRSGFLKLLRMLLRQSGGLADYTQLSKMSQLSRPTVISHIDALIVSCFLFQLPPYHGGGRREIIRRPKIYCFDTGFAAFEKGWESLRKEDRGILWEHLILDELRSKFLDQQIFYWGDKSGREIDFLIKHARDKVDTFECKVNPRNYNFANLKAFRSIYPQGKNYVVSPQIKKAYSKSLSRVKVNFINPADF